MTSVGLWNRGAGDALNRFAHHQHVLVNLSSRGVFLVKEGTSLVGLYAMARTCRRVVPIGRLGRSVGPSILIEGR